MSHRKARVASELRARIAQVVAERVRDPRLAQVSILEVRPAPDFSYARVFFRTLGQREEAERALAGAKGMLRTRVAEGLHVRRMPELDFRYDEAPERAERVYSLLEDVKPSRETGGEGAT